MSAKAKLGQQVEIVLPGTDAAALAFITAIDAKRNEDDGATIVDLVAFPPREQPRALQDVRLYDTAAGRTEATDQGLGLVATSELANDDDSAGAARKTTAARGKAKTSDTDADGSGTDLGK